MCTVGIPVVHNLEERFGTGELQMQAGRDPFSYAVSPSLGSSKSLPEVPFLGRGAHSPTTTSPVSSSYTSTREPPEVQTSAALSLHDGPLDHQHPFFRLTSGPTQLRPPCPPSSSTANGLLISTRAISILAWNVFPSPLFLANSYSPLKARIILHLLY